MPLLVIGVSSSEPSEVSRTADRLEGAVYLSEMQAIVTGDHSKAQVVAFRSALAVNAESDSLFGPAPVPQRHVCFAEGIEQFDQVLDRIVFIVEPLDPQILVVSHERRLILSENPSIATAHGDFGVCQVCDHLAHRPLARTRLLKELVFGFLGKVPQFLSSRLLSHRRIIVSEQIEKELLIGGRLGHRVRRDMAVVHQRNLPVRSSIVSCRRRRRCSWNNAAHG